ncbi:hypothetical protein HDV62DRAFT_175620 [Trichoderma sp. SZMC 28011]
MGLVHVPPAGYVQVTLARHTTPKDSLISAVPISVQLLHSLSICSSYPLLAPQPRRDGKSSHHHHLFPATITIPKTNRRTNRIKKKIKIKTKNREAFPRLSVKRRSWAGQATDPPSHLDPLRISKQQTRAHLRPTPGCLLAPPLRHTATVVDFSALGPFIPGSTFCFLGGIRVIREGHSFASGQKASSYGMGTLPRFSFAFSWENWE